MVRCKGEEIIVSPPDVTDLRSAATSLNQEEQSACIPSHSFRFTFSQGLSCATSRTTQNLPTGPHLSPLAEDPVARSSKVSAGTGQQDVSLLSSTVTPNLTPNLTCSVITTSAPAGTASETPPKAQLKMDEPRAGHTVAPLSHGRVGRWRKRDLETCRASSGLPPAPAPGATIASGEDFGTFFYVSGRMQSVFRLCVQPSVIRDFKHLYIDPCLRVRCVYDVCAVNHS